MIKRIDYCVSCDLPCIGNRCIYRNRDIEPCEICGEAAAEYRVDGIAYCAECLHEEIKCQFDEMSLEEQATLLFRNIRRMEE